MADEGKTELLESNRTQGITAAIVAASDSKEMQKSAIPEVAAQEIDVPKSGETTVEAAITTTGIKQKGKHTVSEPVVTSIEDTQAKESVLKTAIIEAGVTSGTRDEEKGVLQESGGVDITNVQPQDLQKELRVKVYHKWASRNAADPHPTALCFISLDKRGNAIQANAEVRDMQQFESALQIGSCYKITRFGCKNTDSWHRTLNNNTTLLLGKYTDVRSLEDDGFPNHHFNFVVYNQLATRANVFDAVLTDYIGVLRSVGVMKSFGSSRTNRILRKNVEIQNLNGNTVTLSLWNDMAIKFEKEVIIPLEQPIIMAVSSCSVKTFDGTMRLSATPATRYYFNPDVPQENEMRNFYAGLLGTTAPLMLPRLKQQTHEEGLVEEPVKIATLLQISPEMLTQRQHFLMEAVITKADEEMNWYNNRCKMCSRNIEENSPHWHCQQPGIPVVPNYSYCFRTTIADITGEASLTWYSPEAHALLPACSELLSYVPDPNPRKLPPIIRDMENTKHMFEVHFGSGSKRGAPRLIPDRVTDAAQPLPPSTDGEKSSTSVVAPAEKNPTAEVVTGISTPPTFSADPLEKSAFAAATEASAARKVLVTASSEPGDTHVAKRQKSDTGGHPPA